MMDTTSTRESQEFNGSEKKRIGVCSNNAVTPRRNGKMAVIVKA